MSQNRDEIRAKNTLERTKLHHFFKYFPNTTPPPPPSLGSLELNVAAPIAITWLHLCFPQCFYRLKDIYVSFYISSANALSLDKPNILSSGIGLTLNGSQILNVTVLIPSKIQRSR